MVDYNQYQFTGPEKVKHIVIAYGIIFALAYLFYANIGIAAIAGFLSIYYLNMKRYQIIQKRKRDLKIQFKNGLYLLASSISAGYSVENAFVKAKSELLELYQEERVMIIKEFEWIIQNLSINKNIEAILSDFAKRAGIEDIDNFVEVFTTCRSVGGNLNEIIRSTSSIINDKIEIEEEITIQIAKKKLEQKVISVIPVIMIAMLSLIADEYMKPLQSTFEGNIVITVSLLMIVCASWIAQGIMKIEV